jgi:hypothetical protein
MTHLRDRGFQASLASGGQQMPEASNPLNAFCYKQQGG